MMAPTPAATVAEIARRIPSVDSKAVAEIHVACVGGLAARTGVARYAMANNASNTCIAAREIGALRAVQLESIWEKRTVP